MGAYEYTRPSHIFLKGEIDMALSDRALTEKEVLNLGPYLQPGIYVVVEMGGIIAGGERVQESDDAMYSATGLIRSYPGYSGIYEVEVLSPPTGIRVIRKIA
ncbi:MULTISPECIES: hypothetical protein [Achromobacter]|uniref:hypothetical protein n=1 Tax=Achromobacter TaxID=222 RepID=UPI001041BCFD|nr:MULTISPECIES: hypothetical protein [Achromobacter]MCH1985474.1 hypothetical protein [Achromobacter xylosoxidans]MCH1996042.1 hypothetical protein [Achromobacter xylosoxidans]MCH4585143.1 hypothetical protein [Achromobacter xylosoxidans]MCH4591107.1 hypothetical protein [Achromobacter xylosoxidans]